MATPYADLYAAIEFEAGYNDGDLYASADAFDDPAPDSELEASADTTSDLEGAILGTAGEQTCSIEVYVGGVLVPQERLIADKSVDRSLQQQLQTWSFAVHRADAASQPFGSPFSAIGPPVGKRDIDLYACYRTADGTVYRLPLVRHGIVSDAPHQSPSEGVRSAQYSGVDRGGRFDEVTVTIKFPVGHGLPLDLMLRKIAAEAGVTEFALETGLAQRHKELVLANADWLRPSQDMADVFNRRVRWNSEGAYTCGRAGRPVLGEPVRATITPDSMLASTPFQIHWKQDAITDVTVTGTEQLLEEDADCGLKNEPTEEIATRNVHTMVRPAWHQKTDGSFDANPPAAPSSEERVLQLVILEVQTRCGVEVYRRETTYALANPQAVRYEWDASLNGGQGGWKPLDTYTDDDSFPSSSPAFQYFEERFLKVGVSEFWTYYFAKGFTFAGVIPPSRPEYAYLMSPRNAPAGTYEVAGDGTISGALAGVRLGTISKVQAMIAPTAAVLTRDVSIPPYDSWDVTTPANGTQILGGGSAIIAELASIGGEALLRSTEAVTVFEGDPEGFLVRQFDYSYGWRAMPQRPGAYLYADGTESMDAEQTFASMGQTVRLYLAGKDNTHDEILSGFDPFGAAIPTVADRGKPGDRPAWDRLPANDSSGAPIYDTGEEDQFAATASRSHTRTIKARVVAPGLLPTHLDSEHKMDSPWIESEAEGVEVGKAFIDESVAPEVTFATLLNGAVQEGDVIHVTYPDEDFDFDVRVQRVSHSDPQDGISETAFVCRWYPPVS